MRLMFPVIGVLATYLLCAVTTSRRRIRTD